MSDNRIIDGLNGLLADSTVFYQKVRHYHWNVKGPAFFQLHERFEQLYTQWATNIDEVAERIVGLGGVPRHTLGDMLEHSRIEEDPEVAASEVMVQRLIGDLEALKGAIAEVYPFAEETEDLTTVDLLDELRDQIEDDVWMYRAWQG